MKKCESNPSSLPFSITNTSNNNSDIVLCDSQYLEKWRDNQIVSTTNPNYSPIWNSSISNGSSNLMDSFDIPSLFYIREVPNITFNPHVVSLSQYYEGFEVDYDWIKNLDIASVP